MAMSGCLCAREGGGESGVGGGGGREVDGRARVARDSSDLDVFTGTSGREKIKPSAGITVPRDADADRRSTLRRSCSSRMPIII